MSEHRFPHSLLRRLAGGLLGLWLAFTAACSTAPVQEMSEARQAIEAARAAGAEQTAPEQYRKAQALLKDAEQLLNDEHFNKARKSAARARDEAIQAREIAQREKAR